MANRARRKLELMSSAPVPQTAPAAASRDILFYLIALVLGAVAGWSQVALQDMSLLLASAFTLFLAVARPQRPWRWAVMVSSCLPLAELIAWAAREHPERGDVMFSFVAFVPAFMCAYGGAFLRRTVGILFPPSP